LLEFQPYGLYDPRKETLKLFELVLFRRRKKRKEKEEENLKLKNVVPMLLISVMLLASITLLPVFGADEPIPPVVPSTHGTFETYGSRVDHIIFKVAGDVAKEADMLSEGEIDVMDWAAPGSVQDSWLYDREDITMGDYSEYGWYEFDLNLQMWPIGHGSMDPEQGKWGGAPMPAEANWDFPDTWDEGHYWINYTDQRDLDAREFRRALAHLTNRAPGACVPDIVGANMETFIFPGISDWENPAAPKYAYSLDTARAVLSAAGFNDYDGDGWRDYSPSHATPTPPTPPDDMERLPELQLWIRTDDPDRKHAGELLRDALLLVNVHVDAYIASRSLCYYHAWNAYDYHIYTGGWGWGRVPDMYFELWHSTKDTYPSYAGDGYNRYHSKDGFGEDGYDEWAWALKTAPNTTAAAEALDKCQEILHRDVACIPLYTYVGYLAHRTYYPTKTEIPDLPAEEEKYMGRNWTGFINEKGYAFYGGPVGFSGRNVHPEGFEKGGTLRHGLVVDVVKYDPVDAEWFYDWLVLGYVYEPVITYHPLNTTAFIPWLCESYTVGTWLKDESPATKVTFEIIPNILWHDNIPFEPRDVGFSYQYYKDAISVPNNWAVVNFDHYDYNATHVTLYFDVQSWLALEWCILPIIPRHIWEPIPPVPPGDMTPGGSWVYDPYEEDTVIGTGPFRFAKDGVVGRVDNVPGQMIHLEANPTYFRRFIGPDVCDGTYTPGDNDDFVDGTDIGWVLWPTNMFTEEYNNGTWPDPPGDWGPYCDVNRDGVIGFADFLECGVHYYESWPTDWYRQIVVPPPP
jgi:ABC-type transport system substrate-binding protein